MLGKWQAYKKYIIGVVAIVAAIVIFFFTQNQEEVVPSTPVVAKEEATKNDAKEQEVVSTKMLIVDVKGAVNKPGVYELAPDSRVKDAIIKAGGLSVEADVKLLNMAQKVTDEMVVYAGKAGEEGMVPVVTNGSETASVDHAKVNINTADVATLQTIPGIGATKAQAIIDYREKEGLFTTNADLSKVSGIGAKTVERLSEHITVE
ncbi:helix-hairpin-helix domain-containing protein [Paenilisteria rocourtiae]|uniref:Competence protein ComEA n=1 Tax=Listeria rocourtiae TaxID=647910 RepID=A0A4R6ZMN7_9LIST|nr:helix-hairpin-helix domain-containing protein [Listeria rocourtiae]EUJ51602.1 putative integral membrane protein ComEA [Listeria rocourtiae FSL F6-920]MBC1434494.1 ComEA family DNA-binding protein [Listeria rocourtiae]MBC1603846.1 ComEA family DNA-binding protein [Listeria rocourtiae]TDR53648.1 competence protein ComEA [Listeria rocourtiae]